MMKNTFGVDFILAFQANIGDCYLLGAMPQVLILRLSALVVLSNPRSELFA